MNVFETVAKLLALRQLKLEKGRIELLGQRFSMFPTYFLVELQREMERTGHENKIYELFKRLGIEWCKKMNDSYKVKHMDIAKWGRDSLTSTGWGIIEIIQDNPQKNLLVFRVLDSPVCEFYGVSDHPVDDAIRGMVAGAACVAFANEMDCIEVKCKAMEERFCEFVVKPTKEFDLNDPLVKKQLKS